MPAHVLYDRAALEEEEKNYSSKSCLQLSLISLNTNSIENFYIENLID